MSGAATRPGADALSITRLTEAEYSLASEIVVASVQAFWPPDYPAAVIEAVVEGNGPAAIRERSDKQEDYLARRGGRPVGYGAVKQNEIGHLFVHPDAAGQGVGSALVAFSEGLVRERGFETIIVYASLSALGFYEKRGFRRVRPKSFELRPNVFLDSVLMVKPLAGCPPRPGR